MLAAIENIDHRTYRRFTFVLLFPVFRFRNVFTQPEGKNDGDNADEKERTPAPNGHHQTINLRGDDGANREARDQKSTRLVPQVFRPAFNNIGGAGAIFSRHAHPNNQPGNKERGVTRCKTAGQRTQRKKNNAGHHRQAATVAIPHCPEHQAAKPARDKSGGNQACRLHRRQTKFPLNLSEHQGD